MSPIEMAVRGLVGIIPFIAAGFILLFVYRLIHSRITHDKAELKRGNTAAGINRGGAYLGVLIASTGSLILSDEAYWTDLGMFLLDGVIAIGVFTIAAYVFDLVILPKINNAMRIAEGNLAVAVLEACAYVGLGLIMCASFAGAGAGLLTGILSAVTFGLVGLVTLMTIYLAYNVIWRKVARCDVDRQIADGNLAAAIDVGSLLLAMSITLMFSIMGDFTGWGQDFLSYGVAAVSSVLAVSVGRGIALMTLAHKLEKTTKVGDHHSNRAKSLIVGLVSIGVGLLAGLVTFA